MTVREEAGHASQCGHTCLYGRRVCGCYDLEVTSSEFASSSYVLISQKTKSIEEP